MIPAILRILWVDFMHFLIIPTGLISRNIISDINKIIPVYIALIQTKPAKNNCLKPSSSSLNLPPLPLEIWKLIFSYMDFTLLQKIATLVCYEWLYIIRNDRFLSGHLLVSKKGLNVPDINLVLKNWPALKVQYILVWPQWWSFADVS